MKKGKYILVSGLVLLLIGCSGTREEKQKGSDVDSKSAAIPLEIRTEEASAEVMGQGTDILDFIDAHGQTYQVEINPNIEKHEYDRDAFQHDGNRLAYMKDANYSYRLGVDVSQYQGDIDWQKVREAGFEFAFIRLGYRGYGKEGVIRLDNEYANNIQAAQAAGLDVGVYFFAQAVNEEEAVEEARFVLENLSAYELQLPVVYDPENILDDEARTDNVTGEQFTKNTEVFCRTIKEAGYQPMIYCNMLWEAYELDLEQLAEYPVWYADYEEKPQTPYRFEFWQYTNEGAVDGIAGNVDLNIQLIKAVP